MPFAILGALVLLALALILGRRRSTTCRWVPTPGGHGSLREYTCKTCGVTAYGQNGKPPSLCKRTVKNGKL
ncbi:hypothetical protein LGT41_0004970 [Abyssibius alkaniclasticus]|uniref:hypothetical protein n=1 Tax=Abyssibius alkaniclasticus TaxID=2881234 RepID=UPI0023647AAA|nr:hypothetical protein [Abyssibius alkaniclasticus]UPH72178.1 hypothetical protein LGT41_0004970 [Abyssibius alkaniclasticus]